MKSFLLFVVVSLAACGGKKSGNAEVTARLDRIHEIARAAQGAPAAVAGTTISKIVATENENPGSGTYLLANQEFLASADFRSNPAQVPIGWGDLLAVAKEEPDGNAGEAVLRYRWIGVVRIKTPAPDVTGDILIYDATTGALLGGTPFAEKAEQPAPGAIAMELNAKLHRVAVAFASGP